MMSYAKGRRRFAAGLAGTMLASVLVLGLQTETVGAKGPTPPRSIITVIANLNKAYGGTYTGKSLSDMTSIKAFVRRAIEMTPFSPDVVLIQEVREKSARGVARAFTDQTGNQYILAVVPGQHPTKEFGGLQVHKETAIVINTETMKKESKGGFIASKYTRDQAAANHKIKIKKNAHLLVSQKSSGMKVALTSVHFTPVADLKSKATSNRLRGVWSKEIVQKLNTKYPSAALTHIGGDFNMIRCYTGSFASCQPADFWKYFTKNGFVDSLYSLHAKNPGAVSCMERFTGVDYIFSTGNPTKGGVDRQGGYSDHTLRWTLTEAVPYQKC